MPLIQGQILNNRYRIARLLGQGGFGAVYKAWDLTLNRPCAVKEGFELSSEGQRQFVREAQILANLTHPNLPRVTDFFAIPDQGQYLVMDFVEGQDLEEIRLQAGGRLSQSQALGWICQVCDALDYLHNQKPPVIHRDIKPANVKVTPDNRVMLVDFGIAKAFDPQSRTTIGARAVTPGFSPFEQYGTGITDARTDLYAVGAMLYTLLTGQEPPEAPRRIVNDPLVPAQQLNSAISPDIAVVLHKGLQIDPEVRFQSARELKAVISGQKSTSNYGSAVNGNQQPALTRLSTGLSVMQGENISTLPISPSIPAKTELPLGQTKHASSGKWLGILLVLGLAFLVILMVGLPNGLSDHRTTQAAQTAVARDTQLAVAGETQMIQTASAQGTQTALVLATRAVQTARALDTQVAIQRATQTAEAIAQLVVSYQQMSGNLLLGPLSGELEHQDDDLVAVDDIHENIMNFVLDIVFENPYASSYHSWDYGILFRNVGRNDQFRLVIRSNREWVLRNNTGDTGGQIISSGEINNLNVNDGELNQLALVALGEIGYLFINDAYITELDLSSRPFAGELSVASGIYQGDEISGEITPYQDVYLWTIDTPLITATISSCDDSFGQVSIASHFIDRTNYISRVIYNTSFENPAGWTVGDYQLSVDVANERSSGYCYARDEILACTTSEDDPTILQCEAYSISAAYPSRSVPSSIWCTLQLHLIHPSCGDIFTYEYAYEFRY